MTIITKGASAAPFVFSGAYRHCFDLPEVAMDPRHIFILHEILCAFPFKSALEIGSFNGASATAFVEAINRGVGLGKSGTATFCDVSVSDSLIDVVDNCDFPRSAYITSQPSWAVLDSKIPFDFVFVDGAHDIESVSLELARLKRRRPLCVMAHDTSATAAGYSACEGAAALCDWFSWGDGFEEYWTIEDHQRRPGERTERGLFFATSDPTLRFKAIEIFEKWS